jgi:hypothetical protein
MAVRRWLQDADQDGHADDISYFSQLSPLRKVWHASF